VRWGKKILKNRNYSAKKNYEYDEYEEYKDTNTIGTDGWWVWVWVELWIYFSPEKSSHGKLNKENKAGQERTSKAKAKAAKANYHVDRW
jgi:hypothetical protein